MKRMNPNLHKLLLELENREMTDDYFGWNEKQKDIFITEICTYFYPVWKQGGVGRDNLIFGIWKAMKEAEIREDYEEAEIMHQCLIKLDKWGY